MAELRISQDKPALADLEEALESCVAQLEDLYQEREHQERLRAGHSADASAMVESLDAQVKALIEERADIRREIDMRRADIRSFARHVRRVMDEVAEHAIALH